MKRPRARPRFTVDLASPADQVVERLRVHLAADGKVTGLLSRRTVLLTLRAEDAPGFHTSTCSSTTPRTVVPRRGDKTKQGRYGLSVRTVLALLAMALVGCGYDWRGPVSADVARASAERLTVYRVDVAADDARPRAPGVQRVARAYWLPSGARVAANAEQVTDGAGRPLLPLVATDVLQARGTFSAGETLPDGGVVVQPPPDTTAVVVWSLAATASAVLFGTLVALAADDCSKHPECSQATEARGYLWGLAIALPLTGLVVSSVGVARSLSPPLTARAHRTAD